MGEHMTESFNTALVEAFNDPNSNADNAVRDYLNMTVREEPKLAAPLVVIDGIPYFHGEERTCGPRKPDIRSIFFYRNQYKRWLQGAGIEVLREMFSYAMSQLPRDEQRRILGELLQSLLADNQETDLGDRLAAIERSLWE